MLPSPVARGVAEHEAQLAAAVDVLATLSEGNRLVGVISHVQQLKERIDKQVVVT